MTLRRLTFYFSIYALLLLAVPALFESCSSKETSPVPEKVVVPDVYVVGTAPAPNYTTPIRAVYWKNSTVKDLPFPDGYSSADYSAAYSIAASGDDIYIAGYVQGGNNNANPSAVYWKNDVPVLLPGDFGTARAITIAGNDIYVAGNIDTTAVYWKNGVAVPLGGGVALAIAVVNDDVYVAGDINLHTTVRGPAAQAVYWKNGVRVELAGAEEARSIVVVGNDVYAVGRTFTLDYEGWYWKNGVGQKLPSNISTIETSAYDVAVSGSNVYIAGDQNAAVAWVNGVDAKLSPLSTDTDSEAVACFVSGDDVYYAGQSSIVVNSFVRQAAAYWKNGKMTQLSGGLYAYDILVK